MGSLTVVIRKGGSPSHGTFHGQGSGVLGAVSPATNVADFPSCPYFLLNQPSTLSLYRQDRHAAPRCPTKSSYKGKL